MSEAIALQRPAVALPWRLLRLLPGVALLFAIGYLGKVTEALLRDYGKAHHLALPNIEYVLWAIVFGLIIANTVGVAQIFRPGVATYDFWLKAGIVLLGARFLLGDVLKLGRVSLALVAIELAVAIGVMTLLGRSGRGQHGGGRGGRRHLLRCRGQGGRSHQVDAQRDDRLRRARVRNLLGVPRSGEDGAGQGCVPLAEVSQVRPGIPLRLAAGDLPGLRQGADRLAREPVALGVPAHVRRRGTEDGLPRDQAAGRPALRRRGAGGADDHRDYARASAGVRGDLQPVRLRRAGTPTRRASPPCRRPCRPP